MKTRALGGHKLVCRSGYRYARISCQKRSQEALKAIIFTDRFNLFWSCQAQQRMVWRLLESLLMSRKHPVRILAANSQDRPETVFLANLDLKTGITWFEVASTSFCLSYTRPGRSGYGLNLKYSAFFRGCDYVALEVLLSGTLGRSRLTDFVADGGLLGFAPR